MKASQSEITVVSDSEALGQTAADMIVRRIGKQKRISKDGTFHDRSMYFSPNTFSDDEIDRTNDHGSGGH